MFYAGGVKLLQSNGHNFSENLCHNPSGKNPQLLEQPSGSLDRPASAYKAKSLAKTGTNGYPAFGLF